MEETGKAIAGRCSKERTETEVEDHRGTSRLRDQAALNEELKRQRQAQALDFTADLRGGLEQRLSNAEMEEVRERNVVEESEDERVSREYFQEDVGGGQTYSAPPPVDAESSTETSYIPM